MNVWPSGQAGKTAEIVSLPTRSKAAHEKNPQGLETHKTHKTHKGAIRLARGERARVTDEALAVLRKRGDLFERGGELVRVAAGGVEPVADDWLLDAFDRTVKFVGARKVGDGYQDEPRDAPQWLAKRINAKKGERGLRELRAVITAPTMREDGTLLDKAGYDAATGLLLMKGKWPKVPAIPSYQQMKKAAATLWAPFAEFPFVDDTARSVMLAAILTAVIRQTLPLAPAFSFDAPAAGTGKTLLAFCLLALCGMDRQAIPECRDEEEVRKRLLSTLRSGQPGVLFDNIRGQFGSAALEAMLTTQVYSDRLLGGSRMLALPTAVLVLISGNNFRPSGDLWRRLLTCRIDAKTEDPERRSFAIEPFEHCTATARTWWRQRSPCCAASWPRARHGRRPDKLASYEAWDNRVRQAVIWLAAQDIMPAPIGDPVDAIERAKRAEPEAPEARRTADGRSRHHGRRGWRVADLIKASEQTVQAPTTCPEHIAVLRETLEEIAGEHGKINPRKLGRWVEKQSERRCGGLWLEQAGERWRATLWRVRGSPGQDGGL